MKFARVESVVNAFEELEQAMTSDQAQCLGDLNQSTELESLQLHAAIA